MMKMQRRLTESELVLSNEGKVYHLNLKPGDIGNTVFLFGDPGRVELFSSLFDNRELTVENREFVTHTGKYRNKTISAVSTGIGTDNIDIVINELDALLNIDLERRTIRPNTQKLNLIRIGTSGALQDNINPGAIITTSIAGGLDNLIYYYQGYDTIINHELGLAFSNHTQWPEINSTPYFIHASNSLLKKLIKVSNHQGITLSAPGFYGPQGRSLRIKTFNPEYINKVSQFSYNEMKVNNFEMEASALYGLSRLMGHEAVTVCLALANRKKNLFLTDYKDKMAESLQTILDAITNENR